MNDRNNLSDQWLSVGEPVARDDGRFYVPVTVPCHREGLSPVVLRVASDAFDTLEAARYFAGVLVTRWNSF